MHPSKIIVIVVAVGLIVLGMWLMFQGTEGAAIATRGAAEAVNAPAQPQANPAVLGLALIAGGVIAGFMAFRRG